MMGNDESIQLLAAHQSLLTELNKDLKSSAEVNLKKHEFQQKSFRNLLRDREAQARLLMKPCLFIVCGTIMICVGLSITFFHFLFQNLASDNFDKHPAFTYGPISLASGIMSSVVGAVWCSFNYEKWRNDLTPNVETISLSEVDATV